LASLKPQASGEKCDRYATVCRDLIVRWTYSTRNELALLRQPVRCEEEGWGMSSYASYCQDQATDCARRARLASSPEVAAYCRSLEFRWLKLAKDAQETGGALGRESGLAAYRKRAGELIALLRLVNARTHEA